MRFLLLILIFCHTTQAFAQLRVLVLQMQVEQPQDQKQLKHAKYLTELINSKVILLPQDQYIAITKENLTMLLPSEKTLEECIGECEVNVGRIVGSQRVISSVLFDFNETVRLNIKLMNTQDGAILNTLNLKGKSILDLEEKINQRFMELFQTQSNTKEEIPTHALDQKLDLISDEELKILEFFEKCQKGKQESLMTLKDCEHFLSISKNNSKYKSQSDQIVDKISQIKTWIQIQKDKQEEELENKNKRKEFEKKRDQDWLKLSKMLKLSSISDQQKEKAVMHFFEIYGTNPSLNPYLYFDEPYVKQTVDLLLKP
jgi:hypothetical protein